MAEITDLTKMVEMGRRIYNGKLFEKKDDNGKVLLSDEQAIKALCESTFTKNGSIPSIDKLRSFNALIVEVANEEAQAKIQPIIDAVSNYSKVDRYATKLYQIPKRAKVSMALSASGTGVDFVRITPSMKQKPAVPKNHQFGAYYNIDEMISDPVNSFRKAVDYVVEWKVKYLFKQLFVLIGQAKTNSQIPTKQLVEKANITLADFRKAEGSLLRYGNNVSPILIADRNLIDSLAEKQLTEGMGTLGKEQYFGTDELRTELLRSNQIQKVSRTIAVATDNPFTDDKNSKVDLPVNEGLMVAGGDKSPFYITEFGTMKTAEGVPDIEDERVNFKVTMTMDITLMYGQALGYLKDSAITL